jgi:hypothetical protein
MNKAKRTVAAWLLLNCKTQNSIAFRNENMQKELSFAEKASKRTFEKLILIASQLSSVQKQL